MPEIAQRNVFAEQRLDLGARAIVAPVVDGKHLPKRINGDLRKGFLDQTPDIALFVKGWNYDRNTHGTQLRGDPANKCLRGHQ